MGSLPVPRWKSLRFETRKKRALSMQGYHHTEETKQKIRESNKGKHDYLKTGGHKLTSEEARKIGSANKGKKRSDEFKRDCSMRMTGKNNHRYKNGQSKFPYCDKFTPARKRAVREFFSNMCICCGKTTNENVFKTKNGILKETLLAVHHVDHDKEQGCNGKPFNLVPLCISCHAKEQGREDEYKHYMSEYMKEVMFP